MKETVITFRTEEDFRAHLENKARENSVSVAEYIRALLKKGSKYKEKKPTLI
jgi:hypothetical protein